VLELTLDAKVFGTRIFVVQGQWCAHNALSFDAFISLSAVVGTEVTTAIVCGVHETTGCSGVGTANAFVERAFVVVVALLGYTSTSQFVIATPGIVF